MRRGIFVHILLIFSPPARFFRYKENFFSQRFSVRPMKYSESTQVFLLFYGLFISCRSKLQSRASLVPHLLSNPTCQKNHFFSKNFFFWKNEKIRNTRSKRVDSMLLDTEIGMKKESKLTEIHVSKYAPTKKPLFLPWFFFGKKCIRKSDLT